MNITELARRLKITPNELKERLPELGFHIGQRAIQIPDEQAKKVIEIWQEKIKQEKTIEKIKEKISQQKGEETTTIKPISLPPTIQVYSLAQKLNLPLIKVMNELVKNGILANVNESLDYEIAAIIAENLGLKVVPGAEEIEETSITIKEKLKSVLEHENKADFIARPPVVVVMGHVDHGKTSLLDSIRETSVAAQEAGRITQSIGAYQVKKNNRLITFIDTPGHEAFEKMRERGGGLADLAILVIAADDKVQPQTLESIKIIQKENLPFIAVLNKIDKPEANVEKIKKELSEINLVPEDWGGKVICVPLSAKTKEGIDKLLEMIILLADLEKEKLMVNPKGALIGAVVESHLDPGVGPIASLIIYSGRLKVGDTVIIGDSYGRIRSIKNEAGKSRDNANPGEPIQIFGLHGVPQAGDIVEVISDAKEFKNRIKKIDLTYQKKIVVDKSHAIQAEKGNIKYLNIILRTDVLGSMEAICKSLENLEQPEVRINILKKGLGNFTESDIDSAKTAQAILIGFNVGVNPIAKQLASEANSTINIYRIIYDLIDDVKKEINKLLPTEIIEEKLGKLEVLKIFRKSGRENIIGGRVIEGKVAKDGLTRIWDKNKNLKGEGKISQLQINKKDVSEAKEGVECGLKLTSQATLEPGDFLDIYKEVKKEKKI